VLLTKGHIKQGLKLFQVQGQKKGSSRQSKIKTLLIHGWLVGWGLTALSAQTGYLVPSLLRNNAL